MIAKKDMIRNNPYCSGAVELEEGPRVVAQIEGVDTLNPETIKIGMPVKATLLRRGVDEDQQNRSGIHTELTKVKTQNIIPCRRGILPR